MSLNRYSDTSSREDAFLQNRDYSAGKLPLPCRKTSGLVTCAHGFFAIYISRAPVSGYLMPGRSTSICIVAKLEGTGTGTCRQGLIPDPGNATLHTIFKLTG